MLSAVGNAVVVNPDRELRAAAVAMGWPARDFASPVSLRSRLPTIAVSRPPNEVLYGTIGALGLAVAVWRILTRGD